MGLSCSCSEDTSIVDPPDQVYQYFGLQPGSEHDMEVTKKGSYHYKLITNSKDPYVLLSPLSYNISPENVVLTFQYKSSSDTGPVQLFLAEPISEERSVRSDELMASETWSSYSVDLKQEMDTLSWGRKSDYFRLDLGNVQDATIELKNIYFRKRTEEEKSYFKKQEENREQNLILEANIKDYLSASFEAKINSVDVSTDKITIQGMYSESGKVSLCEIPPSQDLTTIDSFVYSYPISSPSFSLELSRLVIRSDIDYDRGLSRWVLVQHGDDKDEIISHGRYADQIEAVQDLPKPGLKGRKGLGGYSVKRGFQSDLEDLGITSVTVNIAFTGFMYLHETPNTIPHTYGGRTYYFDRERVNEMDQTMINANTKNILVAAILLVNKVSECADPLIGELLEHPDYTSEGIFTMPNMTNPESVNCYAAAIDFLASRYGRSDDRYGRIHYWILHNEVDAGLTWTNMGEKPMLVYLDTYLKSMRMCYNISRNYNEYSEVLASFTHSWSEPVEPRFYRSREMIKNLTTFSQAEGDFQWGLAYHTYPQDLNEPKTWNDNKATFSINTPLITFKNLEVLDAWAKRDENKFKGSVKRTVWLSENGTNSRTYSEKDLREQAAGLAYAWKKLEHLDGIDAMQWHNWIDNRGEFGLKIGLRRFPNDEEDPGGRKPVWFVYEAAGAEQEDAVFEKYKAVIGIQEWSDILYQGQIY